MKLFQLSLALHIPAGPEYAIIATTSETQKNTSTPAGPRLSLATPTKSLMENFEEIFHENMHLNVMHMLKNT